MFTCDVIKYPVLITPTDVKFGMHLHSSRDTERTLGRCFEDLCQQVVQGSTILWYTPGELAIKG